MGRQDERERGKEKRGHTVPLASPSPSIAPPPKKNSITHQSQMLIARRALPLSCRRHPGASPLDPFHHPGRAPAAPLLRPPPPTPTPTMAARASANAAAGSAPSNPPAPPPLPPPRTDAQNVLGGALECCCTSPMTGWHRDGFCRTGSGDLGLHTVCSYVTRAFLDYTKSRGNDLETPVGRSFPGLKPGDKWCLCAGRWLEASRAGVAPPVVLAATHARALEVVSLEELKEHAWEGGEVGKEEA
jgi:uncharacterized protein